MKVPQNESSFEPAPAGTHIAICYGLIDLGTQKTPWSEGQRKVRVCFELVAHLKEVESGKFMPLTVAKEYTFNIGSKATLRQDLISWRGRDFTPEEMENFDLRSILGAHALINVLHRTSNSGNEYAVIQTIMGTQERPAQVHPTIYFSFEEPDLGMFNALPEFVRGKIATSPEFAAWNQAIGGQAFAPSQDQPQAAAQTPLQQPAQPTVATSQLPPQQQSVPPQPTPLMQPVAQPAPQQQPAPQPQQQSAPPQSSPLTQPVPPNDEIPF